MNRILTYSIIIGFCFFISWVAINGTDLIANRSVVGPISYKTPDIWNVNISEQQFGNRLFEITLDTGEDFSLVVSSNIGGTADQNIQRWIGQFKKDELITDNIVVQKDSLNNRYIALLEMYGTYEVPNMANPSQVKVIKNDYGLLGGIIEFPNSRYFIKAVGIDSVISNNSDNFREFVYSIRLK
tara:strand:+ start:833 stop:1384 length:552 start_codon:yes stop_codon:yes gene_type:complete